MGMIFFRLDTMRNFFEETRQFSDEFEPPSDDDLDHPKCCFWGNPAFGDLDAILYWSMIRKSRPKRILRSVRASRR